jgi:type 1 glutamine amidotransferase
MKKLLLSVLVVVSVLASRSVVSAGPDDGWYRIFDGKSLNGWKPSEKKDSFIVEDGMIVAKGGRSHLFYVGPVANANFKDFEFKAEVMTTPGSNSGIYFHTQYQETGWPNKGYECQVNNSHTDPKRTAGLYGIEDVFEPPAKDNEWFEVHIIVRDKRIIHKVNGRVLVDYTEPEEVSRDEQRGRRLTSGTMAIQGHDPKSVVYYRNLMIKPLTPETGWVDLFNGKDFKGWKQINGKAKYEVEDGVIVGTTVQGSPNSFLCTKKHYGDFELEYEVKVDNRLNSGVQIRSNSSPDYQNGRVHGYQVEIATNGTAGFIYDEARRRRWLSENMTDEKARGAFKKDAWNKFRVMCIGDSIKTWVNGVPVADVKDSMTSEGFIGLQVHSFKGDTPAQVRWRNIRIRDFTDTAEAIKAVIVTGGHGYDEKEFFEMCDSLKGIEYVHADQKDDSELFEDISNWDYDVIVLYNMSQRITQKRQENFIRLLKEDGIGLVAVHHCLAAFQDWPEYKKIIGAKFYTKPMTEDGVEYKVGSYKHDVNFTVHVKDTEHPVTKGLKDFEIFDETYKGSVFQPDNKILLTTEEETSDENICWVREYGKARVCYIQLGHGKDAYENKSYRRLLKQAIKWCADD